MFWYRFIIGIFLGFALLIGTLVTLASKQNDIALVSQNYYQEELDYQKVIEAEARTSQNWFTVDKEGNMVSLTANRQVLLQLTDSDTVHLSFLKPENEKLDSRFSFAKAQLANGKIPLAKLKSGVWFVKIVWEGKGTNYCWRSKLYL